MPRLSTVSKRRVLRALMQLVLLVCWPVSAHALTPLPDNSPAFFSGEWAGNGGHGSYCYLKLDADGWGWALIDGGAGDWMGARLQWRNRQQALQVEKIIPLSASPRLRIMPLEKFAISSGFNQSLKLTWNEQSPGCQLQKLETTERHLFRARKTMESLLSGESRR